MKQYRSAQGKIIDMAALASRNERVRAVGNMKVNARGDTIDANGKVILPVTQKVGDAYQKTVGNKSAHVRRQPVPSNKKSTKVVEPKESLTKDEFDLESNLEDDLEVEAIKAKETKK